MNMVIFQLASIDAGNTSHQAMFYVIVCMTVLILVAAGNWLLALGPSWQFCLVSKQCINVMRAFPIYLYFLGERYQFVIIFKMLHLVLCRWFFFYPIKTTSHFFPKISFRSHSHFCIAEMCVSACRFFWGIFLHFRTSRIGQSIHLSLGKSLCCRYWTFIENAVCLAVT